MLFDPSVSNAPPALAAVNLRVTPKGTVRATLDFVVQPLGIVLTGCVLRRHDCHLWVDLPQGATGVVSYAPDGRRRFQEAALAAISAVMASDERAAQ